MNANLKKWLTGSVIVLAVVVAAAVAVWVVWVAGPHVVNYARSFISQPDTSPDMPSDEGKKSVGSVTVNFSGTLKANKTYEVDIQKLIRLLQVLEENEPFDASSVEVKLEPEPKPEKKKNEPAKKTETKKSTATTKEQRVPRVVLECRAPHLHPTGDGRWRHCDNVSCTIEPKYVWPAVQN